LKAGTSIGVNVKEAVQAQSKKDFISKMNIALKEANETEYWITVRRLTKSLLPLLKQQKYSIYNCQLSIVH